MCVCVCVCVYVCVCATFVPEPVARKEISRLAVATRGQQRVAQCHRHIAHVLPVPLLLLMTMLCIHSPTDQRAAAVSESGKLKSPGSDPFTADTTRHPCRGASSAVNRTLTQYSSRATLWEGPIYIFLGEGAPTYYPSLRSVALPRMVVLLHVRIELAPGRREVARHAPHPAPIPGGDDQRQVQTSRQQQHPSPLVLDHGLAATDPVDACLHTGCLCPTGAPT